MRHGRIGFSANCNIYPSHILEMLVGITGIKSRRLLATTLFLVVALAAVTACSSTGGSGDSQESSDPVERGQRTYAANCAVCHGADGEGQPDWQNTNEDGTLPAPPLNGSAHTWHHGDGTLYKQIELGGAYLEAQGLAGFKSGMPAFGDILSHEEIIDVLNYVKSLWGDQMIHGVTKREAQARVSENDPFPAGN